MRHALLRLLRLLGVEAAWFVPKPRPEVFLVTKKKFHNALQGVGSASEAEQVRCLEHKASTSSSASDAGVSCGVIDVSELFWSVC